MRLAWVSLLVALPLALAMCGPESNTDDDEGDDDGVGGASSGGNGKGGSAAGGSGTAGSGGAGATAGTRGEAGAAGDDGTSGGMAGAGGASAGSSGMAGSGGCDEAPTDVLILLDRSASMQDPPEGYIRPDGMPETRSKWEVTIPPLLEALSETTAPIRWGLKTFPEGATGLACAAGSVTPAIDVSIAEDTVDAVIQAIQATSPDGDSTPTGDALLQSLAYLQGLVSENPKYVLLVTDGEPSCSNVTPTMAGIEGLEEGREYAVQALTTTLDAGVPTFLVGIGANKESAKLTLDRMAEAGGRPAPQPNPLAPLFYLANSPESVTSAFDSMLESASPCYVPPPPSLPLPYHDDFESGAAPDWRFTSVPWTVIDEATNHVFALGSTGDSETTWAIGGDRNWTDVRVEMRVKFVSGDAMILLSPRFQDLDSFMFVEYQAEDKPKLRRRLAGSTADIVTAADTLTFAPGQWHTVAVTLNGATATLEFDGVVLGMGTDSTPVPRGGIGIAAENGIIAIDDVRVSAP